MINAPCTVRPVRAEDIPAIQTIYSEAVQYGIASWELTPPDLAKMQRRIEQVLDGGYPYFMAESDELPYDGQVS
jgi:phosphinothricin acetyltransferase